MHIHGIIDSDARFSIKPSTRQIRNDYSRDAKKLIQGDHNSERLIFEVPRVVEGHDMSLCTKVSVHYNNISADKKSESRDVYIVDDVQVSPADDSVVTFSWLISCNATRHAGILSFLICFECLTGTTIDYAWHTALYSDIKVGEGMSNDEHLVEYSDVLEAWRSEIVGAAAQATVAADRTEALLGDAGSKINRLDKRITNLEQGLTPDPFEVDGSVAYTKIVPDGALPYAEVAKVGGMSHSVDGSLVHAKVTEVKSFGKNRAVSTDSSISSERGIEITRNIGKSSAVLNGTSTAEGATRLFGNFKLPVGTYTASVLGLNSTDRLYVGKTADGGVVVNYIQTKSPKTFTLTEETECFLQVVWGSGSIYNNAEIKVQIEHGNTATEYKPYTESSLPIPSAVQALPDYGLGVDAEYHNYIDWDKEKYYKYCGALDLSRQSISKNTNNNGQTIWGIDLASIKDLGVCDKYTFTPTVSIHDMQEGTIHNRGTVLYICDSSISSASEIKGTFIYALETPEVIDISGILPADNLIRVESGGPITPENEHGLAVPTEIIYQLKGVTA